MKKCKKLIPFGAILAAVALFVAAFLLEKTASGPLTGFLWAAGGILLGLGSVTAVRSRAEKQLTPEQRQDLIWAKNDERNISIREKAALESWHWTLYLLWAAFVVVEIFLGNLWWGVAFSGLIVAHCCFYAVNLHRWSKKL